VDNRPSRFFSARTMLLINLWKNLEENGRKWKIMITFVPNSVKEKES
jgi:hypothetical protein